MMGDSDTMTLSPNDRFVDSVGFLDLLSLVFLSSHLLIVPSTRFSFDCSSDYLSESQGFSLPSLPSLPFRTRFLLIPATFRGHHVPLRCHLAI